MNVKEKVREKFGKRIRQAFEEIFSRKRFPEERNFDDLKPRTGRSFLMK